VTIPEMVTRERFELALRGGDPDQRLLAIKKMREFLARSEREAVRDARRRGRSWGDIGRCVGMSRQAARQKFAGLPEDEPETPEDVWFRQIREREELVTRAMFTLGGGRV
jgi:hypothetical protein